MPSKYQGIQKDVNADGAGEVEIKMNIDGKEVNYFKRKVAITVKQFWKQKRKG